MPLKDKVAVITGAASGIAKEIAHAFSKEGAKKKEGSLTPEDVAEERIARWKRGAPKTGGWTGGGEGWEISSDLPVLDLRGLGLTEIPASLRSIRAVQILSLANNKITELPSWLGGLKDSPRH